MDLCPDKDGKARLFLRLTRADGSAAVGTVHECAVRTYDPKGRLLDESQLDIEDGNFGESPLMMDTIISDLVID